MTKFSVSFALILGLISSTSFANFIRGRVDTVVVCSSNAVNGYQLSITEVEGFDQMTATLASGGVAGFTPIETFSIKSITGQPTLSFKDISTNGKNFLLQVQSTPKGNFGRLITNSKSGRLHLQMVCKFPVRPM